MSDPALDLQCINTLRFLAVDAVEKAASGHPGLPLGAAPMAYVLWDRFLRHNPANPQWFDRDRFVLSAGHGSALLYALLHLFGYGLPLEQLQRFRQYGSQTPGHPEYGLTVGVEATTGPLGQGFGMAVGMAIAEAHQAARYNVDGCTVIDHRTYVLLSDGDLMEGIGAEAASLAGHLRLGKLIALYDSNAVSLDGPTALSFSEDTGRRFEAYGWQVQSVADGNDLAAIDTAIQAAVAENERPSLILVHTHIGYGSPKQDSHKAHGEPLGPQMTRATKERLGWPPEASFFVPAAVQEHCRRALERGAALERQWQADMTRLAASHPSLARELASVIERRLPDGWHAAIDQLRFAEQPIATREAGQQALDALAERIPALMGGAADLSSSTRTVIGHNAPFAPAHQDSRNVFFGVREHAMGAAVNGMALHHLIAYGSTFLAFSDYMRASIRLGALMKLHSVLVFTHDSISLGEDGPTHQPVEQLTALRLIPELTVLRPSDALETAAAWKLAMSLRGPCALVLARQKAPVLNEFRAVIAEGTPHGAYVLWQKGNETLQIALIATGFEVHLALAAARELQTRGVAARVVSMPSWELFDAQPADYRREVLPRETPKLSIEAGVTTGWRAYVGDRGRSIGLDHFGASAPGEVVYRELGFTVERIVRDALELVKPPQSQV
jgi:transketolase